MSRGRSPRIGVWPLFDEIAGKEDIPGSDEQIPFGMGGAEVEERDGPSPKIQFHAVGSHGSVRGKNFGVWTAGRSHGRVHFQHQVALCGAVAGDRGGGYGVAPDIDHALGAEVGIAEEVVTVCVGIDQHQGQVGQGADRRVQLGGFGRPCP